eukprot:8668673-Lingulodinium_polyedra.AAC.1
MEALGLRGISPTSAGMAPVATAAPEAPKRPPEASVEALHSFQAAADAMSDTSAISDHQFAEGVAHIMAASAPTD